MQYLRQQSLPKLCKAALLFQDPETKCLLEFSVFGLSDLPWASSGPATLKHVLWQPPTPHLIQSPDL